MKKILAFVLVVAAMTGCADDGARPGSEGPPSVSDSATTSPEASEPSAGAMIYAAVIQELVLKDHTFGGGRSPFDHVYVKDGVVSGAGDPMGNSLEGASEPFSEAMKEDILSQLDALPPTEFVSETDDVRRGQDGMNGVKNNGVIIVLGPIEEEGARKVHVENSLWCGGLCGQWMTYVLKEADGTWAITGTTGPAAIS